MSFLNPIEELINYIISHIHEGLLMNKLDPQQLKANISEGTYILQDVQFNSKSINQSLPYSAIHLKSAKTSKMNLFLPPLLKILECPVKVRFTDLELNLISAKSSGDSVSLTHSIALSKSDETPGLNIMTKSIGKFLSSINIEVVLLSINLYSPNHSVNIQIPKLTISEVKGEKFFRIEGISVFVDRYEPVLVLEEVLEGTFKLNSSQFEVMLNVPELFVGLSYRQLEVLLEIFDSLEMTDKFEDGLAGLVKTIKEIGDKIDLGTGVKKQSGQVCFRKVDFVLSKFKNVEEVGVYKETVHEKIQGPHFHFRVLGAEIDIGERVRADVGEIFVDFFQVVEENQEILFKSARDCFFPEFFHKDSKEIVGKLFKKNIVAVKNRVNCEIFEDLQVGLQSLKVQVNSTVIAEAENLTEIFSKLKKSEKNVKTISKSFKIDKFIFSYQQEINEIWTSGLNLSATVQFLNIEIRMHERFEANIQKILGKIKRLKETFKILEIEGVIIESIKRSYQRVKKNAVKKYSAFFEQNQGCITVANTKTVERKEKLKHKKQETEDLEYEFEFITKISCGNLDVSIDQAGIFNALLITLPDLKKSSTESQTSIFYKTVFSIRKIKLQFCEFSTRAENLDLVSCKGLTEFSVSDFAFQSSSGQISSTSEKPLTGKLTNNSLKIKLADFIVSHKVIEDFFNFSLNLPDTKNSEPSKTLILKLLLTNSTFIITAPAGHLVILLEDCQFLTFSTDFSCGSLKIGSFKLLFSNTAPQESDPKSIQFHENLKIFASGSCISSEKFQKFPCYLTDCEHISDNFYCTVNPTDQQCKVSVFSIGTLIFHICKDTFEILSGILAGLSFKPQPDLSESTYFETNSSLYAKPIFHLHNSPLKFPEHAYESYNFLTVSSIFIHIYPELEFPESAQGRKSVFNQIVAKIQGISCVYLTTSSQSCVFSVEIVDIQLLNSIKGCEIKKFLQKSSNRTENVLKLQVLSESLLFSTDEIVASLTISPTIVTLDSAFIEFFLALCTNDSPELISDSKSFLKIRTLTIDPIQITLNYLQPGTNMLNLINTENFHIHLPRFEAQNLENFESASQEVLQFWQKHLERHKMVTIVTRLSPIVSVANIARALVRIAKSPFDPNSEEGAKEGVLALFKVLSVESVKFCDSFVIGISRLARVRVSQPFSVKFQRSLKYL